MQVHEDKRSSTTRTRGQRGPFMGTTKLVRHTVNIMSVLLDGQRARTGTACPVAHSSHLG
jgi:hypothetical protein